MGLTENRRCCSVRAVCVWRQAFRTDGSGRPELTFHRRSVILHGLMGTECAHCSAQRSVYVCFVFFFYFSAAPPNSPFSLFFFPASSFSSPPPCRFDIYRKVPKDLTQPTYTGAFSKSPHSHVIGLPLVTASTFLHYIKNLFYSKLSRLIERVFFKGGDKTLKFIEWVLSAKVCR